MTTVRYKGFRIAARPYQLHATGFWAVEVEIHRKGRMRAFSGETRYPTEVEATAQALALGRQIVAGNIRGWSVDSLR